MRDIVTFTAVGVAAAATFMLASGTLAQDDAGMAGDESATPPAQTEAPASTDTTSQPADAANAPADAPAADAAEAPAQAQAQASVTDLSYALGYVVGNGYGRNGVELEPQEFARGLQAGLSGGEPRLTEEQMQQILMGFEQQLRARQIGQMQEQARKGQQFLQTNGAKEGVTTTASGLQYQVLKDGQGESPKPEDTVRVHYRGTLVDGTQFDSSYDRGEPAEFAVGAVIAGWTEALQLMKPGAKYRLVIPPDLAYGPEGRPPVIPPSAVLVFDVELLDVLPAQ